MNQIPYFVFAWIASLSYGLEAVIGKLSSKYSISNPWLFNFWWNFFIMICTIPAALYYGAGFPSAWLNIFLASISYTIAGVLFILALFKLDITVLTPLFSLRTAFAVILGVVFLKESIGFYQYILLSIIFIFGLFVTVDERYSLKAFWNMGLLYALGLMFFVALEAMFINKAVAETNFWVTTLWITIICQILLVFTVPLFLKDLKTIKLSQYGNTFVMGFFGAIAGFAANKAVESNISISSAIMSLPASMIMTVIISIFKPGVLEKHTIKVYLIRFISAAIMILSALKLN